MKLYFVYSSPASRIVLLTLEALGVDYEIYIVDGKNREHKSPKFLKINPQGQVPVLIDGDVTVTQSRAIIKYLCNAYGATSKNKNLYPSDLRVRTRIDELLFLDCDIKESIASYVNTLAVFRDGAIGVNEANLEKARSALDAYERILSKQDYLVTGQETLADFSALVTLGLLDMVHFDLNSFPGILKWKKRMSALPYYDSAYLKGHEMLTKMYYSCAQKNIEAKNTDKN